MIVVIFFSINVHVTNIVSFCLMYSYIFVIPLLHQLGLVGQQMHVPVESLEVANEVVVDVAGGALLEEGGPVLVIVPDLPVHQEVYEL